MRAEPPPAGSLAAALVERVRFTEPPLPLRTALLERFEAWALPRRGTPWRERVTAVLASDRSSGAVVAGLRGPATERARQLLFSSDLAEVALHLREDDTLATIDGQVLPLADDLDDDVVVELWCDAELRASVAADASGSFVLTGVPAGRYGITVAWADVEMALEPVDVEGVA